MNRIDFPEKEHQSLRTRLDKGLPIYSTRVANEQGKYSPGMCMITPWGDIIQTEAVQTIRRVQDHPFLSELNEEEIDQLKNHVLLDIIRFNKPATGGNPKR